MKKSLLVCIAVILVLLVIACVVSVSRNAKLPEPTPSAEPTPEATPEPTPEPTPETTPDPTPEATPEATPEPTPEATPEPTPEQTPEPTPEATPEPTPEATPEPTPGETVEPPPQVQPGDTLKFPKINTDSPAVLGVSADMGQSYIDNIVFLGDSTTYGMKYYAVLSGGKETKQVWTPTSGTLTLSYQGFAAIWYPDDDEEISIREAVERKKPAMMVITLGVNGISFMDHDDFVSEYTSLVTDIMSISPDTKVIIQSIFPVASTYEYLGSINNEKITTANTWLLEIAENTGARYLDTISALMGSDGWLPQSLQNGDGLHLNTDGFNIILNYIRTHGWE